MGPPLLTFGLPSCLLLAGIQHGLLSLQLSNGEAWREGCNWDPGFPVMIWMPFHFPLLPGPGASCPVLPGTGTAPCTLYLHGAWGSSSYRDCLAQPSRQRLWCPSRGPSQHAPLPSLISHLIPDMSSACVPSPHCGGGYFPGQKPAWSLLSVRPRATQTGGDAIVGALLMWEWNRLLEASPTSCSSVLPGLML